MTEANDETTSAAPVVSPAAPHDRMHALVCKLSDTWAVMTEIAGFVEEAAGKNEPLPLRALTRLLWSVEGDVEAAHTELDQLWLDTAHASPGPGAARSAVPRFPADIRPLDRGAFRLAIHEEMAKAGPDEFMANIIERAMVRVRAFLSDPKALPAEAFFADAVAR